MGALDGRGHHESDAEFYGRIAARPAQPKPKVMLVSSEEGDWEGLYVDGEIRRQGHSLDARHVLDALRVDWDQKELGEEAFGGGYLPHYYEDIGSDTPREGDPCLI